MFKRSCVNLSHKTWPVLILYFPKFTYYKSTSQPPFSIPRSPPSLRTSTPMRSLRGSPARVMSRTRRPETDVGPTVAGERRGPLRTGAGSLLGVRRSCCRRVPLGTGRSPLGSGSLGTHWDVVVQVEGGVVSCQGWY